MYESISKNNELENEMTLDMSYFWYSDDDWPKFCHRLAHNMLLGCSLCCFVLPTLP